MILMEQQIIIFGSLKGTSFKDWTIVNGFYKSGTTITTTAQIGDYVIALASGSGSYTTSLVSSTGINVDVQGRTIICGYAIDTTIVVNVAEAYGCSIVILRK